MNRDDLKKNFAAGLKWLIALVGTVVITGIIKGDQLKGLSGLGKFKATIWTGVPLWGCLLAVAVVAAAVHFYEVHDKKRPKLTVFWHLGRCYWWPLEANPSQMQIVAEGMFTLTNTTERITLTRAYFKGTTAVRSLEHPIEVIPGIPVQKTMLSVVSPPRSPVWKATRETLVFVDNENREHVTPKAFFQPSPQNQALEPKTSEPAKRSTNPLPPGKNPWEKPKS